MKRRFVLVVALLFATLAFASAAPKYSWKLASVLPDSHPVHQALVFFADELPVSLDRKRTISKLSRSVRWNSPR